VAALLIWSASLRLVPGVTGVVHDDGVYVSTARSLAQGDGYRLISLPDQPEQTKYPILYPALLAFIWMGWPSFPGNLVVMQWVTAACAAASLALAFLLLVRFGYTSRLLAFGACAVAATSPMLVYLSTLTMSEMPFALLLMAALWRAEQALVGEMSRARQFVTGVAAAAPFLCRAIGLALLVAVPLALVGRRRPVRWTMLGLGLAAGAWIVWSMPAIGRDPSADIVGYYTDYSSGTRVLASPRVFRLIGENTLLLVMGSAGLWLQGVPALATGAGALVLVLGGGAAWIAIARDALRARPVAVALVCYAALVVIWPWRPARFLVPVLPLLAACTLRTLADAGARFGPTVSRRLTPVLLALCVVAAAMNLRAVAEAGERSRRAGYPLDVGIGDEDHPGTWRDHQQLFTWLREQTPPDAILASGLDTMMFLYTDRKAFRPVVYRPEVFFGAGGSPIGEPDDVRRLLRQGRASFLVLSPGYAEWRQLRRVVGQLEHDHPGLLRRVYAGADNRFEVFAIAASAARE
jgi:hypothetical protein